MNDYSEWATCCLLLCTVTMLIGLVIGITCSTPEPPKPPPPDDDNDWTTG